MALVEHPMNNFLAMDTQLYEQNIQVGVVDLIKSDVQPTFTGMEESFQELADKVQELSGQEKNSK